MKWELVQQTEPSCYDLYDGETCIGEIKTDVKTALIIENASILIRIGEVLQSKYPQPDVIKGLVEECDVLFKKIKEIKSEKFIRNIRDDRPDSGHRLYDGQRDLNYESKLDGYRLEILKGLLSNETLYERHTRYEMIKIANEMAHLLLTFEEKERK